jgi:RNA polymerase sigma-70 factor (ECF subfamily)
MRARVHAAYTDRMDVGAAEADCATLEAAPRPSGATPTVDPVAHLAAVYRDYPGLRALIIRRVRDPELAADILQDAAVTTLEKLRAGVIAHPEGVGGYLYRVALNHLRNHRRKDRGAVTSSDALESLPDPEREPEATGISRSQWAIAARRTLEELPASRDRELLVRFYLDDEDKDVICESLGLSTRHFNRVIYRARNRFRALLESRGYARFDLLSLAGLGLWVLAALVAAQPGHAAGTADAAAARQASAGSHHP